jgi:hypothetical protein
MSYNYALVYGMSSTPSPVAPPQGGVHVLEQISLQVPFYRVE